jgi:hypothetical protein
MTELLEWISENTCLTLIILMIIFPIVVVREKDE